MKLYLRTALVAILFLLTLQPGFPQENEAIYDSLWAAWNNDTIAPVDRSQAMYSLIWRKFLFKDPDSAFSLAKSAEDYAHNTGERIKEANFISTQGVVFLVKGQYELSIPYFERALEISNEEEDVKGQLGNYTNLGICYRNLGRHKEAIEIYEKTIDLAKSVGDTVRQSKALGNLGNVYDDQGNYQKAISYHTESLRLKELIGKKDGIAASFLNIGVIYYDQGDLERAEENLLSSLKIYTEIDNYRGLSACNLNLGNIYSDKNEIEKAISSYQNVLDIEEKTGNQQLIAVVIYNMGVLYAEKGEYNQAFKNYDQAIKMHEELNNKSGLTIAFNSYALALLDLEKFQLAREYGLRALSLAKETGNVVDIQVTAETLWRCYKANGQSSKALKMYELSIQMKDSISSEENKEAVIRQEFKYEYEKQAIADSLKSAEAVKLKEAELKAEQAISSRRTQQTYFLIAGLALALALGGFAYNRYQVANKQKEVIQEQADKLEELAEFRTNFFTNITHEFRTPLTVIQGVAQNIDTNKEEVEMIQRNSKRLLDLITQILDLSKLESGNLEVNYKQMDASALLSYFTNSFKSLADVNQQSLELDIPSEELWMDVDEEKLQTLMNNLLSNAFKFTPEGGIISVHAWKKGNELEVQVKDSGSGIPDSELDRVFDRFYQVKGREARKIGSGVGLALSKEIVRVLGGDISASNNSDKGASFSFTLPIKQEHEKASISVGTEDKADTAVMDPVSENGIDSDKPLVLVVEDEADIRTFVKGCLEGQFSVLLAENGEQGVEMAIEKVPDLIISDVMMPVKDGLQLTDELKNDSRTSHIPIVILSAKADLGSRLEGLKRGAEIYLPKPFEKKELLLHLENLLKLREKLQAYYAGGQGEAPPEEEQKIEHEFLTQIKEYLEEHLDDSNYGITELCSDMALSRMQLHRKLKALTGQAASDYLNAYKLEQAKEMLLNKDLNISEIAYSVGYSDPGYFTRIFNKKYGKSPSEFRSEV